ncbi:MAG: dehydrogenase [Candidatus Thermofonsia Clade 3 bacterium]|jgi:2-oxoisovalerate dehydrogenase E1 component|uniref:Dehydrogenase n=1 Tax=Candidatus Thermofonsia Clade 3 bacterium TaxID=2364212 RepID=A0A2M8QGR8_9CHLR|nr:alpha-ketoacid dehydrogenase subunit alpha/beta [Candidatus Roseilinea sp. NK_OTU-006]PJF48964.1 MAG: dehydrogenase [Candidatus Thermofonsia Clade 3 bacterium]
MPKSILIDPAEARASGVLTAPPIPLNAYVADPAAEAAQYGSANLVRIYRDMVIIREFETMLDKIKKEGNYAGIRYDHRGPAHLSIGQEAAAVGQCYHLTADDFIFGSHRSHGEIIAKCLSAIAKMSQADVQRVMEGYLDGAPLRIAERIAGADFAELAITYVLYGTLAEIFGRATGFNRGMGGSMHAFFPPFGVMPNNAIVGGSADIALGAALYKRVNRKPGIVIANIGDASIGCGPVWEAMNFAAMDQFHTLWDKAIGGHPPILFSFINNFYGMGGQPKGETMGFDVLARVGLGVNPQAMHAERVDGYNPLAVADAIARKRSVLEAGQGPVLLDVVTYRYSGHSPSDASSYRDAEEVKRWQQHDALLGFRRYLLTNGHADESALDALVEAAQQRTRRVLEAAISLDLSPRLTVRGDEIGALMFSNAPRTARNAAGRPEVLLPREQSRLKQLAEKHRFAFDPDGKPYPKLKTLTYAEALTEAMLHHFYEDPTLIAFGEENRDWGGAFGVYRGLTEALPYHRLFNTPISEAAIVGAGVGYALCGGRAVVELMYADFMGRAGDEIFNQMAKWQAMSGGVLQMPLVLRVSVGNKYGAQHSQDWSALVAHIPGLQVFFPATPYDAKGMLNLALHGSNPVVFFESQRLYPEPEKLTPGGVPVEYYEVPLGQPAVRRAGNDVTIITIGATLYVALEAARELERYGISAEVIDLRFLNPLDYTPLVVSVRKTGRAIVASDACERGSFAHTVASNLSQLAFDALDGPIAVLGARNWIVPPAEMEDIFFPQPAWIVDVLHERILPIPGYTPRTVQSSDEIIRRNRLGV